VLLLALLLEGSALGQAKPKQAPANPRSAARRVGVHQVSAQSRIIYVDDANWGEDQEGSPDEPFATVGRGQEAAAPGDTIIVRAHNYPEKLTLNKAMTIQSEGGIVTIGKKSIVRVPNFSPSKNGFHFSNWFATVPYKTITFLGVDIGIGNAHNGVCGGMVFAVRDFYEAGLPIPADASAPSSGPLFDYLVDRLIDSFNLPFGLITYMDLMNPERPDHDTWLNLFGHGRAWVMINDEWPKIKSDLDNGRLSPLGLIETKSLNPLDLGENHQVLAYGYDLDGTDLTIYLYDPNHPYFDVTMSLSLANPEHTTPVIYSTGETIWCFFRVDYSPPSPVRFEEYLQASGNL
jgi:hypothetical protein